MFTQKTRRLCRYNEIVKKREDVQSNHG